MICIEKHIFRIIVHCFLIRHKILDLEKLRNGDVGGVDYSGNPQWNNVPFVNPMNGLSKKKNKDLKLQTYKQD